MKPTAKEVPVGFAPGDEVRLRSGGPKMVVEDLVGRVVHASWFDGLKLKRSAFFTEALKPEVES